MSKRCRRRFLQVARSHFDLLMVQMCQHLKDKLPHVDRSAHRELTKKLSTSLVDGETVLFEDPGALGDYTLRRLRPRCRALLEVLLAENCSILLESLLKRLEISRQEHRALRIASLGGGPGFDGIALLAALAALKEAIQQEPNATHFLGTQTLAEEHCALKCTVFDLAPAWATALSIVSQAAAEIWPWQTVDMELVAPIDLRDSVAEVVKEVGQADIVIAAYVLHENEAALLVDGLLGGTIPDVFRAAPVDVPLIFLDATHRLWPNLLETARVSCQDPSHEAPEGQQGLPFRVLTPEGLGSHIHAIVFIKSPNETVSESHLNHSLFDLFTAHQRANEMRLKRLNERQKIP